MSFLKSLFGSTTAEAVSEAVASHGHRTPSIRFVGPRTSDFWKAHGHAQLPPGTAEFAKGVVAPSNVGPYPTHGPVSAATSSASSASTASMASARFGASVNAAPQTVSRPVSAEVVALPVTGKGPAAPSSILLYPEIGLIPRSYRSKAVSQKEIEMVDSGGIYEPPKPAKKDSKRGK
ncbi:hypothetical protein BC830DRAFT_1168446 [Chytriomyces sp. MP71]|nr:hypothetical protein BC830DRAFT_1168446 [Chytriomyces sp. MP71]